MIGGQLLLSYARGYESCPPQCGSREKRMRRSPRLLGFTKSGRPIREIMGGSEPPPEPTPTPTPAPARQANERMFEPPEVHELLVRERAKGGRLGRRAILESIGLDPEQVDMGAPLAEEALAGDLRINTDRRYGQNEVSGMMVWAREEGDERGKRYMLEQLGLPQGANLAQIKDALTRASEVQREAMSEAERRAADARAAEQTAAQARAAAEADRATAAAERLAARKERVLTRAGVSDEALDVAVPALGITLDDDEATISTKVEALKTKVPGLFGTTPPKVPPAPSGGPTGTPPRQQPTGDAFS